MLGSKVQLYSDLAVQLGFPIACIASLTLKWHMFHYMSFQNVLPVLLSD